MGPSADTVEDLHRAITRACAALATPYDVALWVCDVPDLPPTFVDDAAGRRWLGDDDLEAVRRRPEGPVRQALAARRLLRRVIVSAHTGQALDEVLIETACARCEQRTHGRPVIAGEPAGRWHLATSASHATAVVAVSTGAIGLDVEGTGHPAFEAGVARALGAPWSVLAHALRPREDPLELWTAFEALTKGIGLGLPATALDLEEALARLHVRWFRHGELLGCLATTGEDPAVVVSDLRRRHRRG